MPSQLVHEWESFQEICLFQPLLPLQNKCTNALHPQQQPRGCWSLHYGVYFTSSFTSETLLLISPKNGSRADYVIVSKIQWKPFWLATLYPQKYWTGWHAQNGVKRWRMRTGLSSAEHRPKKTLDNYHCQIFYFFLAGCGKEDVPAPFWNFFFPFFLWQAPDAGACCAEQFVLILCWFPADTSLFEKGAVKKNLHQQPQKNSCFVAVGAIFFTAPFFEAARWTCLICFSEKN